MITKCNFCKRSFKKYIIPIKDGNVCCDCFEKLAVFVIQEDIKLLKALAKK